MDLRIASLTQTLQLGFNSFVKIILSCCALSFNSNFYFIVAANLV